MKKFPIVMLGVAFFSALIWGLTGLGSGLEWSNLLSLLLQFQ